MATRQSTVDLKQTTNLLNVSEATIRNWVRQSYITPTEKADGKITFDISEIDKLRKELLSGHINKLKSRANKQHISTGFIPSEYLSDKKGLTALEKILSVIRQNSIPQKEGLFLLMLYWAKKNAQVFSLKSILDFNKTNWKSEDLLNEFKCWFKDVDQKIALKNLDCFEKNEFPESEDVPGLLYQSLIAEGDKSKRGSYYTPAEIVSDIIKTYVRPESQNIRIIDPCCGSGQFLLGAISQTEELNLNASIYGYDIDETAVRLAKINALIRSKKKTSLNIKYGNFLLDKSGSEKFDLIISNPPWGAQFKEVEIDQLKAKFETIITVESFSYFIAKSLELLKPGGVLSFILPESILNVKAHRNIRKLILESADIEQIISLNRVFKKVFTPVIRMDIRKKKDPLHKVFINLGKEQYYIFQDRFLKNENFDFDIKSNEDQSNIVTKIYSTPHTTLKENADWALGIVTGNNDAFLSTQQQDHLEPIIKGGDILPYKINKATSFINFQPQKLQQVAPEHKYRTKEKLVYRFISKKLILALDTNQQLCLNSANCIIPNNPDYPVKVILALFNSILYQYLFKMKFDSIKVLRTHLEALPLPLWEPSIFKSIIKEVDYLINNDLPPHIISEKISFIDAIIFDKFGLNKEEIESIKGTL